MKTFDSTLTHRGTKRKQVYTSYGDKSENSKEAMRCAVRDFKEDRAIMEMGTETIKPFKHIHNDSINYWLRFERATLLRFNI